MACSIIRTSSHQALRCLLQLINITADPIYGTLDDIDTLIRLLKDRNIKLIMDVVANHTSDQHSWFKSSISSPTSSHRNWYIWRQPSSFAADGTPTPPNNWASILNNAHSAWTYDLSSKEYFLSLFTSNQPDLNWDHPPVREAIYSAMRFWLDRGVAGFRLDVINCISKPQAEPGTLADLPDADISDPGLKYQPAFHRFVYGPHFHEYVHEMHEQVLKPYNAFTVGESDYAPGQDEDMLKTIRPEREELDTVFQFDYLSLDQPDGLLGPSAPAKFDAADLAKTAEKLWSLLRGNGCWGTVVLENHDQPRSLPRYVPDSDEYRVLGANLLALLSTTLPGTLFIYQGQELGLRNLPSSWPIEEYKDIFSQNFYRKAVDASADHPEAERKEALDKAMNTLRRMGRDHARAPMPWTATEANAGFCAENVEPWMRLNDDWKEVNADAQQATSTGAEDKNDRVGVLSPWQFWRRGLVNRKKHMNAFVYGGYRGMDVGNKQVWAYERWSADSWVEETKAKIEKGVRPEEAGEGPSRWLVVLNFSGEEVRWQVPQTLEVKAWVAGNYSKGKVEKSTGGNVFLRPWEGMLGACTH